MMISWYGLPALNSSVAILNWDCDIVDRKTSYLSEQAMKVNYANRTNVSPTAEFKYFISNNFYLTLFCKSLNSLSVICTYMETP